MRCIECEEIELARVSDVKPAQTLPIPHQALDGFPAGRTASHLTRRRLLQRGVAGFASIYGAQELGWETVWESVAEAAETAADKPCLVLLYLAGGNDGLNVVLPSGGADYSAYANARPTIGRVQGPSGAKVGSMALPGPGSALAFANVTVSGAANNGDTRGFDTLYGNGTVTGSKLAVMPAVDAIKYSLSHFDNSDLWFEATADLNNKTGWLGRWIDRNGDPNNPLQGVSIDTALSKAIRTSVMPVCALNSLPMAGFKVSGNAPPNGSVNTPNFNEEVRKLAAVPASAENAYLARTRAAYDLTYRTAALTSGTPDYRDPGYPKNGASFTTLSNRLRLAAELLHHLGTRVITIHWGGFDTHTNQLAGQDGQLKELSRALAAFQADLEGRAIDQRVVTLVFSEFGRRVMETTGATPADAGTDHGAGGLMLAMGSRVRGGLAADWPGCEPSKLVPKVPPANPNQGNLSVPTDFRSVYQSIFTEWLGGDSPETVLGGPTPAAPHRGDGQTGLFNPLP